MKPYFLLLLLLFIPHTVSGLSIDAPSTTKIEVNVSTTSKLLEYKVTGTKVTDEGFWGLQMSHRGSTITIKKNLISTWVSEIKFKMDIIKILDSKFDIDAKIVNAQATKDGGGKGRYLLFSFQFYAFTFNTNDEKITPEVEVRVWKDHFPSSGGGGIGDVPISNIYLVSLIVIVIIYRKKIK